MEKYPPHSGVKMEKRPLRVLLTGAAGFIGRNLFDKMCSEGMQVDCIVRDPSRLLSSCPGIDPSAVIVGDLNDTSVYSKLSKDYDVLVHSAGRLGAWRVPLDSIMRDNVGATEKILSWFSDSDCKHLVFMSTPGVQGFGFRSAKEGLPYNPRGAYEQSKVLAERKISGCCLKRGQHWTILRPDFVYGPGDLRRIPMYKRIGAGCWINIGSGSSVLRPTYVDDVCEAVSLCSGNPRSYSNIFNIGGPRVVSAGEYVATIAKALDARIPKVRMPTLLAMMGAYIFELIAVMTGTKPLAARSQVQFLTRDHGTDISKARELLGFVPKVDLVEGIRRTLSWAGDRGLL